MSNTHHWSYSRCHACTCEHKQILPSGPINQALDGTAISPKILIIGDLPGKNDERAGIPFDGPAGKELNYTYLALAGLRRDNLFTTYMVQCRQERDNADIRPSESLISSCSLNHLSEEIWTILPDIIILCGAIPCTLLEDSKLEFEHGFPREVIAHPGLFGWSGTVVPMYSPGAGMKDSKFMIPQLEDWERLGEYLRGEWEPPTNRELAVSRLNSKPKYFLAETRDQVQDYFQNHGDSFDHLMPRILAIDSESDEDKDWSIQVSIEFGTGLMVRLSDHDAIDELSMYCHQLVMCGWVIVFHQEQADIDLVEHLGIDCTIHRDTMSELYHLGNLPQGLKAAVYRTLGKRMRSYVDVVLPWSKDKLANWLAEALNYANLNMSDIISHPIGKSCMTCGKTHRKDVSKTKPHECEAVLRRVMKHMEENPEYDPWVKPKTSGAGETKMRLFGREWLPELESSCGRMPRASIVHVPILEARDYGCSDADHTRQLANWLDVERERIVRKEWRTA